MLADELSLLLEGARVTAQSMGRDGLGDRYIRMGQALHMIGIVSHANGGVCRKLPRLLTA